MRFGSTSHDGIGYAWRMSRDGNILSWDIEGIELPPNVEAPEGEGFVTFTVNLLPGLASGTQLQNQATIIFDYNEPIETNVYLNTLDLEPPTSQMISAEAKDGKVTVRCEGYDDLSGVARYKYYVAVPGKDFEYFGETFDTQLDYDLPANVDATAYRFYALAVDNVGNQQATAPSPINAVIVLKGDVNGDGQVGIGDIVAITNVMAGIEKSERVLERADVNEDGQVGIGDIVAITNIMAGLE